MYLGPPKGYQSTCLAFGGQEKGCYRPWSWGRAGLPLGMTLDFGPNL